MHPYDLNFQNFQIQQWLEDGKINCIHEVKDRHGSIVHTNQMIVMVNRCKCFNERFRVSIENDTSVKNVYAGKLLGLCEKYSFKETVARFRHANFDTNTPYILPGWSCNPDENSEAGGLVVLVSTMDGCTRSGKKRMGCAG